MSLLTFIAPEVAIVVSGLLICVTLILDVMQIYRYDADIEKAKRLLHDYTWAAFILIAPFGEIQSLIDMFHYILTNSSGGVIDDIG